MRTFSKTRFWLECVTGLATGGVLVVTQVQRDWIEVIFGVDPDQHSGFTEGLILAALVLVSLSMIALARAEWQKARVS